ncbi:MAG: mechanosensitive ion channel domain-containing protein [Cyanobacteria bacterium P01_A01_bin.114]
MGFLAQVEPLDMALDAVSSTQEKLIASAIGLTVVLVLRLFAQRWVNRQIEDARTRYHWRKSIGYISGAIALLVAGVPWLPDLRGLSTFLGIIAAGLAVTLKEPISDMVGWAFILVRQPFHVGDRIEIGDHAGDVIDIRIFQFTLMEIGNWVETDQSTGRVIHVPNGKVFQDAIANYSKGFQYIWNEIPVLITFESNWEKAKAILHSIADENAEHLSEAAQRRVQKAAQKYMIFYAKLTPTVYTSVRDSGVLLTIRYLCAPRHRRGTEQAIWETILRTFVQHDDIQLAYPTQRFYTSPQVSQISHINKSREVS